MEALIQFCSEHTYLAHFIFFGLLMLAGLNVPISEDLLVISGGYIASANPPNQVIPLYLTLFFGCWISAWEGYWLGRQFGPKLYEMRWFKRFVTPERIAKLHHYFDKFGIFTFIFGRFIPGGFRNVLFMGAGLSKMKFFTFLRRDIIGCLLSSLALFSLGYYFQENSEQLSHFFKAYNFVAFVLLAIACIAFFWYRKKIRSSKQRENAVNFEEK